MRVLSFSLFLILGCVHASFEPESAVLNNAVASAIEGQYSTNHDGSTQQSLLELLPNGEYHWSSSGCFSFFEVSGTFQREGDLLRFFANESSKNYSDAPRRLYLRRWNAMNVLLQPEELEAFDASPASLSFRYLQMPQISSDLLQDQLRGLYHGDSLLLSK